jgi:hypothetical protein
MFVENPDNHKVVAHLDENIYNNKADNLRYCYCITQIKQYNKSWKLIWTFLSLKTAHFESWVDMASISRCCNWKQKTAWGYTFTY